MSTGSEMQFIGEHNGLRWHWADERFARPGLVAWDGEKHIHLDDLIAVKMPRWIPVEERLPEENEMVFVSTLYGSNPVAALWKDGKFWLVDEDGFILSDPNGDHMSISCPTHWMELLPLPPKEDAKS